MGLREERKLQVVSVSTILSKIVQPAKKLPSPDISALSSLLFLIPRNVDAGQSIACQNVHSSFSHPGIQPEV